MALTLPSLPEELLDLIVVALPLDSTPALNATNKLFYRISQPYVLEYRNELKTHLQAITIGSPPEHYGFRNHRIPLYHHSYYNSYYDTLYYRGVIDIRFPFRGCDTFAKFLITTPITRGYIKEIRILFWGYEFDRDPAPVEFWKKILCYKDDEESPYMSKKKTKNLLQAAIKKGYQGAKVAIFMAGLPNLRVLRADAALVKDRWVKDVLKSVEKREPGRLVVERVDSDLA